jgi:predicted dinucleotide-binding enzyme
VTDVGIIGAGRLGQAMARVAVRAGRSVVIANSRGPESLSSVAAGLGVGARVVKAANTLGADVLASDPHQAGGQRVIFISGDDVEAKSLVALLFQEAGFATIDLGDLATGGAMQQIHHPLAGVNLIRL